MTAAEQAARTLLRDDPHRLAHSHGVARTTTHVGYRLDRASLDAVVAAAWLHDIGYAPSLMRTGFHPLDGALHLAADGWPDDVVRLVAHHSHAMVCAPYYGVDHHLAVLEPVVGGTAEILTFADLVAGTDGKGTTVKRRIDEMRQRHSAGDSPVPADVREARYALLERTALTVLRSLPSGSRTASPVRS